MKPIRRILGYVSVRWKEPVACEACGGEFTCGATLTGCWCSEVTLTDDARAQLRQQYKKCLCRACLERQAAASMSEGRA